MSRYVDLDQIEFLKVDGNEEFNHGVDCCINRLLDAEPVKAVPLDKVKQAREEIAKYQSIHDSYCEYIEKGDFWKGHTPNHYESSGGKATACDYFLQILDKLIAESEEK